MPVGAYPGSFNPPTVAHLAVAEAARDQCGLERVDLIVSRDALGKHPADLVSVAERVEVLRSVAATRPWLGVAVTDDRLLTDIAADYDVVVVGADKWAQVLDPAWYGGSLAARDTALARLPRVALAPRAGHGVDAVADVHPSLVLDVVVLEVHPDHHVVSASQVRAGRDEWMLPEAAAFAHRHAVWRGVREAPGSEWSAGVERGPDPDPGDR